MALHVNDVGKLFRLATSFNMSAATSLTINFTKPDGTTLSVTTGVTAPAAAITDPDLGALAASEYMQYSIVATNIDQAGVWRACGIYTTATESFSSAEATFTVLAACT